MMRGVLRVDPLVANPELHVAERRADHAWRMRLYGMLA
jgi:hypothetical protein